MCTVFIRYCRIPLGLFQKNTRERLNSHRERHVPLPISSDFCDFFVSRHTWWFNISKSSCSARLVFPIAVMWEGYWLAKMCTNREISLMIGDCELPRSQNVIKYYVLQMTVIIGLLPASVFFFFVSILILTVPCCHINAGLLDIFKHFLHILSKRTW